MSSLNKWLGLGRLTADPQSTQTSAGKVATFTIAINERWKAEGGGSGQATTFVPVMAVGGLAESVMNYLSKGREVLVEGKLQIDTSQTCEHGRHSRPSIKAENIQFLGGKQERTESVESERSLHSS